MNVNKDNYICNQNRSILFNNVIYISINTMYLKKMKNYRITIRELLEVISSRISQNYIKIRMITPLLVFDQ